MPSAARHSSEPSCSAGLAVAVRDDTTLLYFSVFKTPPTMARIRKTEILSRVYLLEFASQYELAATFLRFQEHYESPRFRRKVFSLEQYMDWYAREYGAFTYYEDWAGFNVPSSALKPFFNGRFDPLQEKEKRLLRLFFRTPHPYYVIGRVADDSDSKTLRHELAHALFCVDRNYRREVRRFLAQYNLRKEKEYLLDIGYCREVLDDELQGESPACDVDFRSSTRHDPGRVAVQL